MAKRKPKVEAVDGELPAETLLGPRSKPYAPVTGRVASIKDPRIWKNHNPAKHAVYRRILGLDLSTACGAAYCDIVPGQLVTDAVIIGSQWDLTLSTHDTQGIRFLRLMYFLQMASPDLIVYEEVKYSGQGPPPGVSMSMQQMVARAVTGAQVVHSLAAVLLTWAERRNIPCQSVPIKTLKKYATGSGAANKEKMIDACNLRFGTVLDPATYQQTGADNVADAMFLCGLGVDEYAALPSEAFERSGALRQ